VILDRGLDLKHAIKLLNRRIGSNNFLSPLK
jgi:hypothetical protein